MSSPFTFARSTGPARASPTARRSAMTQSPEIAQQALAYIRHQAAKSLPELAALMERTGAECARCLEDTSDAQASFSHGEEWSMKEVLGHMLGSSAAIHHEITARPAGRAGPPPGRPPRPARRRA